MKPMSSTELAARVNKMASTEAGMLREALRSNVAPVGLTYGMVESFGDNPGNYALEPEQAEFLQEFFAGHFAISQSTGNVVRVHRPAPMELLGVRSPAPGHDPDHKRLKEFLSRNYAVGAGATNGGTNAPTNTVRDFGSGRYSVTGKDGHAYVQEFNADSPSAKAAKAKADAERAKPEEKKKPIVQQLMTFGR